MEPTLLYDVENEEKIKGELYKQVTDLTVGNIEDSRIDLFVIYQKNDIDIKEYVIQTSSGTFITNIGLNYNIWHII